MYDFIVRVSRVRVRVYLLGRSILHVKNHCGLATPPCKGGARVFTGVLFGEDMYVK